MAQIQLIPAISHPAPPWSGVAVIDLKLQELSSLHFIGKYLILVFYPYDFSFLCPTELLQFSDRIAEFRALDAEVVAVSTDSEYTHLAWIMTPRKQGGLGEMRIPLLANKNHQIARDYGVLDVEQGVAYRALFVIDAKQIVRHITINAENVPRSVDEVLRIIKACLFVDKHGHTCPFGPIEIENSSDEEQNYFEV